MVKSLLPAVSLMVLAAFAGCADEGGNPSTQAAPEPPAFNEVEVTDTTGAIRGVVVTEAIVPIEGVLVQLTGGENRTTDVDGAFVFNGLEPGTYFLTASKVGYFSVQASTEVVAGDKQPPVTKISLAIDQATQPYAELLQWTSFFGCGFGTNVVPGGASVNPCAAEALVCDVAGVCVMGTDNVHEFPFGEARIPDFAQGEMVWEGTQPLGNDMNLGWHDSGTADFKSNSGASPLIVPTNKTEILEYKEEDITALTMRVFPGQTQELTITLQQRFDVYVSYFYGFEPREGWAFAIDGACEPYTSCM